MMNEINHRIGQVHRRLVVQGWLDTVGWALTAALLIGAIALGAARVWPLGLAVRTWDLAWLAGSIAAGLAVSFVWTLFRNPGRLGAAVELDRACRLNERVSSCLCLTPEEYQSRAAQALLADTHREVAHLDAAGRFPIAPGRSLLFPLIPGGLALLLVTLVDARIAAPPEATVSAETQQVERSTKVLRRQVTEIRKQAAKVGLKEVDALLKDLDENAEGLAKKKEQPLDRRQALVKLNDVAKKIHERREQLGGEDALRQQLRQIKQLPHGPADALAKALREGDFKQAAAEARKLQQQMAEDGLTEERQAALAQQLKELEQSLRAMDEAQRRAMDDLKQKIARAESQGNPAQAAQLQQLLDRMMAQAGSMQQLDRLAQQLGRCAEAMGQSGSPDSALRAAADLAAALDELQSLDSERHLLQETLDQIAQCKNAMGCSACNGQGCSACRGNGAGQGGRGQSDGLGEGQGSGDRPETATKTGQYDSRVQQQPGRGQSVLGGLAEGPNIRGQVLEQIRAEAESSERRAADPLSERRLTREQREHAQEFFDRFRQPSPEKNVE